MKYKINTIALIFAVCGTTFVCCKKDNPLENTNYNTIITVKNTDAKTRYNHGDVEWLEGDQISVIRGNSSVTNTFATFTIDWEHSTNSEAKFLGTLNNTQEGPSYYAIYPAQNNLSIEGGRLTCMAIRTQQTLMNNTFGDENNTAVGASPNTDMYFRNLGGLVKIAVRGNIAIKSIKITNNAASNNTLSGRGSIDVLNDDNLTIDWDEDACVDSVVATVANTTTGIDVSSGTWFYLVLPPCTLSNYTVTITDVNNNKHSQVFTPTIPLTISRAKVTMLGGFEIEEALPTPSFTVNSSGLRIRFAPGNLRCTISGRGDTTWSFAPYQYSCTYNSNDIEPSYGVWEHFGWSGNNTNHWGMNTSTNCSDYMGETLNDWGQNSTLINDLGSGWRTLTKTEWDYIFSNTNRHNRIIFRGNSIWTDVRYVKSRVNKNGSIVNGVILFPDDPNHAIDLSAVDAPYSVNTGQDAIIFNSSFGTLNELNDVSWDNVTTYSISDWRKFEDAGCVFLPAAGGRNGSSVFSVGSHGAYWSSTPYNMEYAYFAFFFDRALYPQYTNPYYYGFSVRLVRDQH